MLRCTIEQLDQLTDDIAAMPGQIEKEGQRVWDLKKQIATLQSEIDERSYQLQFEINTDKAKYPNKESRDAALKVELDKDDGVRRRRQDIADLEDIKQLSERAIWKLKDEFTVLKYTLRASCAVLEGLCDPIVREVLHGKKQLADAA